jgi:AraC-like DNA-binding protein
MGAAARLAPRRELLLGAAGRGRRRGAGPAGWLRRPADVRVRGARGRRPLRRGGDAAAGRRLPAARHPLPARGRRSRVRRGCGRNQTLPLEDVVGARSAHRLADESRIDAWIRSVELDRRAAAAVRLLTGELRVEDVSARIGISDRQLRRIVLAEVGVGPKAFQRIARLRRLLASAGRGDGLAGAAAAAGYSDQAHMTREVSRLSGLTPAALLAERRRVHRS